MSDVDEAFISAHAHAVRQIIAGWAFGVAQVARTQAPVGPAIPADGLVRVDDGADRWVATEAAWDAVRAEMEAEEPLEMSWYSGC